MRVAIFLKVPSLFEAKVGKHVKNMEHHIVTYEKINTKKKARGIDERSGDIEGEDIEVGSCSIQEEDHPREYYEQKRRVTRPVALEDLFKARPSEKGVSKAGIRKVLLYGNPGSGKTCISKVIAHKWALGEMAQEFEAVYVVPIRRLKLDTFKCRQRKTLKEVVALMCFEKERSNAEMQDLLTQVDDDLDSPSTLLMFDGMDEADDDAAEFLLLAEKRSCKLLIMSRPYNLRELQTRVDFQVECLGFNDEQLRNFVHEELREDEAQGLINSLQENPALWEMAHIPVTSHVLCSLSKEHGTAFEGQRKKATMFQIYNDMTNFVWKRFGEKHEAETVNKVFVFEDLERIAFEALRSGQILIEEPIVESCATSTYTSRIFKESGFLLLVLEGHQYQFPHLTFEEYFAGRYIARNLRRKRSKEEKMVLEFVQRGKYNQMHALTISFAMHAYAKGRNKDALHEMLSIMDSQPVEVLGLQHFFLRMRVLSATLEEADGDDLEMIVNAEEALEVANGARKLLEGTIDNVPIRKMVVEKYEQVFWVLDGFPRILNETVEQVKRLLTSTRNLSENDEARIEDALKLARHSPKHITDIVHAFLQPMNNDEERHHPTEGIMRLVLVASGAPRIAGDLLPMLERVCSNEDSDVRHNAIEAIKSVVEVAPYLARDLIPILEMGMRDGDSDVRHNAMLAITVVVRKMPHLADDVMPLLERACIDRDSNECADAMEAIKSVVGVVPRLAKDLLSITEKQWSNKGIDTRADALRAAGSIVEVAPQLLSHFLSMLKKGCNDEESNIRRNAMEAAERIVRAAPQHAGDLLPLLEKGCMDRNSDVRRNAMWAASSVVEAAPSFAIDLAPMLMRGCADEHSGVRHNAIRALGKIARWLPHLTSDVIQILEKGCTDEHSGVRQNAIRAVGSVVESASHLAEEFLPMIEQGCNDDDFVVRRNVMRTVGKAVVASVHLASNLLPILERGCNDEHSNVRMHAMEGAGSVIDRAPQLAKDLFPMLKKGCNDEHSLVRQNAVKAIGSAIEAVPHISGQLLPIFQRLSTDEYACVRMNALRSMKNAVDAEPHLAVDLLPMLQQGCDDEDSSVRESARKALNSIKLDKIMPPMINSFPSYKNALFLLFSQNPLTRNHLTESGKASFVLHATSSVEIGKWDEEHLDQCIWCLRQEFDKTIPGMSTHHKTKENNNKGTFFRWALLKKPRWLRFVHLHRIFVYSMNYLFQRCINCVSFLLLSIEKKYFTD